MVFLTALVWYGATERCVIQHFGAIVCSFSCLSCFLVKVIATAILMTGVLYKSKCTDAAARRTVKSNRGSIPTSTNARSTNACFQMCSQTLSGRFYSSSCAEERVSWRTMTGTFSYACSTIWMTSKLLIHQRGKNSGRIST